MRRSVCLISVATVAMLASAQMTAQLVERPVWHTGDTWTYKVSMLPNSDSSGTFESREILSVSSAGPDGYDVEIRTLDGKGTLAEEWHGHNSPNAYPISKATANGDWGEARWPSWPLEQKGSVPFAGKQTDETAFSRETNIAGWEEIAVPAGRFLAIRIVTDFKKGLFSRQETWWYVPAVKRYVRYEEMSRYGAKMLKSHTISELLSFTLG